MTSWSGVRGAARASSPTSLSRRGFLSAAAAGAVGLGLAACGASGPGRGVSPGLADRYGVRYRYGDAVRQATDLVLPPGVDHRGARLPVVALFHGGGWAPGSRRADVWPLARAFALRGYAVWNVDYRVLGIGEGGGWPSTFEDTAAAIDLLADVATRWPIDPESVLTAGVSAGGTLAAWAAGREGLPKGTPGSSPAVMPKAVISCAGLLDLAWNAEGGTRGAQRAPELITAAVTALLGGTPDDRPRRYHLASPIERLPFHVPSLVAQGLNDLVARPEQAERFVRRARVKGDECQYLPVDDAEHSSWDDPESEGWQQVFEALPDLVTRSDLSSSPRR